MENDAVIAHAFQEELSQVASAEEALFLDPAQDLVLNQQWLGPGGECHDSDNETGQKVLDDNDSGQKESDHCNGDEMLIHTAEEKPEMEEFRCTLDIADESVLDGEVGKRLNQMVLVLHVPKTNGQMPSEDGGLFSSKATRQNLVYDLVENKVEGDGNCQFRALSD